MPKKKKHQPPPVPSPLQQQGEKKDASSSSFSSSPSSSSVTQHLFASPAYLACRKCIDAAKILEKNAQFRDAYALYQKAVQSCDASIEAFQLLANMLQRGASSSDDLQLLEVYYRKALGNMAEFALMVYPHTESEFFALEMEAAAKVQDRMGLLLCQQGREEEATAYLHDLKYKYRLSSDVLNYDLMGGAPDCRKSTSYTLQPETECKERSGDSGAQYFQVYDEVLPAALLQHMQSAFAPSSPFWREHHYGTSKTGYFSYLYDVSTDPRSSIEQMIQYLLATVRATRPDAGDIRFAEWWVHSRPHSYGHQLHFDSDDEGRGGIRHPTVGSVLFIDGEIGGPTLMTNQKLGGMLADKGWLVHPRSNRLVLFDGRVLHGVVPGKGFEAKEERRRMTFMTAFWNDIKCRVSEDGQPGSAQPFPSKKSHPHYTWMDLFSIRKDAKDANANGEAEKDGKAMGMTAVNAKVSGTEWGTADAHAVAIPPLKKVWQGVKKDENVPTDHVPHYDLCFQGF